MRRIGATATEHKEGARLAAGPFDPRYRLDFVYVGSRGAPAYGALLGLGEGVATGRGVFAASAATSMPASFAASRIGS